MQKVIIIGGTSGIGYELAKIYLSLGAQVAVCGRRIELLNTLTGKYPETCLTYKMDVSATEQARNILDGIFDDLDNVDLVIISSGTGFINKEMAWDKDKTTLEVNVLGFAAISNLVFNKFLKQGYGQIAGISSIAALRGSPDISYNASKAFVHNCLEGLSVMAYKNGNKIHITEIMPGLVDTAMAQGEGLFWVAPVEKAAKQIHKAIAKKKKFVYITHRWRLIAWLLKILPGFIYKKLAAG